MARREEGEARREVGPLRFLLGDGIEPQLIVILSDINMPGMDGLMLLGEIKQRWPELPVMMVTAYGDQRQRHRHRRLQCRG